MGIGRAEFDKPARARIGQLPQAMRIGGGRHTTDTFRAPTFAAGEKLRLEVIMPPADLRAPETTVTFALERMLPGGEWVNVAGGSCTGRKRADADTLGLIIQPEPELSGADLRVVYELDSMRRLGLTLDVV